MEKGKVYTAIGLMSGTSLDGVDAALIETDGYGYVKPLGFVSVPYQPELREKIRDCFGQRQANAEVSRLLTLAHVAAVRELGARADLIGFHGQTITHDPAGGFTLQIGDPEILARETGMDVVFDFRSADVRCGGQGAPLLPLYHRARASGLPGSMAILNIGGVANVTYIDGDDILAFDTGPGNALMDDAVLKETGKSFDEDGKIAAAGTIDEKLLTQLLAHDYFSQKPPKSLDRNAFERGGANVATLTAFTVHAIKKSMAWLPSKPREWLVAGGGRKNVFMMTELQRKLGAPVRPVEAVGWNGDALEAEGFAYLAVRSFLGEPLSLPETTGVEGPMTGGVLFKAP